MPDLPPALRSRAFTRAEAKIAGLSDRVLNGPRFVRIHVGVYRSRDTTESFELLVAAALLILPADAAASHVSCLRILGLSIGPEKPLHFATSNHHQRIRAGLVVHRFQELVPTVFVKGIPVVSPYRTFIDCATQLGLRQLVAVGDWLAAHGHVTPQHLRAYVERVHFDGVQRARRAARHVTERSASTRESEVRWDLSEAGLPRPEINAAIYDDHGQWLAPGDLVYRKWKVLVEYDGWQHERDAAQRQRDHLRREALEAAGWRVIVVTSLDMAKPSLVVVRVRQALRQRGCPC
ncbi:MAG: DUF559 domain-containing protein [Aeromicrobium sp.]